MSDAPLFYQPPGPPAVYFPSLAPHVGGVKPAILLNQLVYWSSRTKDPGRWFYKDRTTLQYETGFSRPVEGHLH